MWFGQQHGKQRSSLVVITAQNLLWLAPALHTPTINNK
jgi:hypothetical protein